MKLSAAPFAMFALLAASCGDVQTTTDSGVADARAADGADADTDADGAPNNVDGGNPDAMFACTTPAEREDGNFCNGLEQCTGNECVAGAAPNLDDGVACTVDTCNETTDAVDNTPDDSICGDNDLCNGVETCDAKLGCRPGTAVQCPTDTACLAYSCISASGTCVANDVAYSIRYTTSRNSGTLALSCNGRANMPTYISGTCTWTCSCEMNAEGGLHVGCTGVSSVPDRICALRSTLTVTTGCSATSSGVTSCCFP